MYKVNNSNDVHQAEMHKPTAWHSVPYYSFTGRTTLDTPVLTAAQKTTCPVPQRGQLLP